MPGDLNLHSLFSSVPFKMSGSNLFTLVQVYRRVIDALCGSNSTPESETINMNLVLCFIGKRSCFEGMQDSYLGTPPTR